MTETVKTERGFTIIHRKYIEGYINCDCGNCLIRFSKGEMRFPNKRMCWEFFIVYYGYEQFRDWAANQKEYVRAGSDGSAVSHNKAAQKAGKGCGWVLPEIGPATAEPKNPEGKRRVPFGNKIPEYFKDGNYGGRCKRCKQWRDVTFSDIRTAFGTRIDHDWETYIPDNVLMMGMVYCLMEWRRATGKTQEGA